MKSLKFGNVVLCDYVAQGHANKFNLVNAISGDIIVARTPADIRFGLYLELLIQPEQLDKFKVEILFDGKLVVEAEGDAEVPASNSLGLLAIPLFPVKVERDADLEVFVSVTGFKRTRALHRRVFEGVMPSSVLPPPS